jgi:hypothetical protein
MAVKKSAKNTANKVKKKANIKRAKHQPIIKKGGISFGFNKNSIKRDQIDDQDFCR